MLIFDERFLTFPLRDIVEVNAQTTLKIPGAMTPMRRGNAKSSMKSPGAARNY
jgi:hypothetical protein